MDCSIDFAECRHVYCPYSDALKQINNIHLLEQFCNPCKYSVTASKHDFTVNAFTGVSSGGGFSMHTQPWYMQVLSFYYLWSFFCVCLHFFFNVDPSLQIRFSLNCERVVSYVDNFGWVTHWKCVEKHLSFFMIM